MMTSSADIRSKQTEAGKQIVKNMLADLANSFPQAKIADLVFKKQDFDTHQISLIDPDTNTVVIIFEGNDLADTPATPSKKRELKKRLREAVITHFGM